MAGKKGCSGRKGWDKELEAKALWDLSIPVLKFALKSKSVKFNKKIEIALSLINKMIPASPLIDQSTHNHYVIFRNQKSVEEENASSIRPRAEVKDAQLSTG